MVEQNSLESDGRARAWPGVSPARISRMTCSWTAQFFWIVFMLRWFGVSRFFMRGSTRGKDPLPAINYAPQKCAAALPKKKKSEG